MATRNEARALAVSLLELALREKPSQQEILRTARKLRAAVESLPAKEVPLMPLRLRLLP